MTISISVSFIITTADTTVVIIYCSTDHLPCDHLVAIS